MLDVFVIFYFSFRSKPDEKSMLNAICSCHENETSDEIKTYTEAHQNVLKKMKLTKAGKERKEIIFEKLIVQQ